MAKPSLEVAACARCRRGRERRGPATGRSAAFPRRRYGDHDRHVATVEAAADNAACQGHLVAGPDAAAMGAKCTLAALPKGFADDWVNVVTQATNSNVLK